MKISSPKAINWTLKQYGYRWRSSMLSYAPYFKTWRRSQLPFINLGAKQCCHLVVKRWTKEKSAGKSMAQPVHTLCICRLLKRQKFDCWGRKNDRLLRSDICLQRIVSVVPSKNLFFLAAKRSFFVLKRRFLTRRWHGRMAGPL
jgi:hypothetical protein